MAEVTTLVLAAVKSLAASYHAQVETLGIASTTHLWFDRAAELLAGMLVA